jgi:phenylacetate-coenzyme A ligase PaaK-like adenylate-forming protein
MDARLMLRTLAVRSAWQPRDRWDRESLERHQVEALTALRRHAYRHSTFYRRLHAGLREAPLAALPVVTKADLMANFDEALTDPRLSLARVQEHLRTLTTEGADPGRAWRGRWWAAATAGTSGRRGVFVWDRREWAQVLASYSRANDWAGVHLGVRRPTRLAVVSSLVPTHQSAVVGASVHSHLVPTLRLDATSPLRDQVRALTTFGPTVLVGYASALRPLAREQLAGRLHLSPHAVMSASEILAPAAAHEMEAAWGSAPWDVYAATETATIASPCARRTRHLYEDLVVCENVDDDGHPVAEGQTGSRILVTVLFARTLPLIRYELTDRVAVGPADCDCGRPYRSLLSVEGRLEEVLHLPGTRGPVRVHPDVFHSVLEDLATGGWQVIRDDRGLRILLLDPPPTDPHAVAAAVTTRLQAAGVAPLDIRVEAVETIPRTALGKRPLIVNHRADRS